MATAVVRQLACTSARRSQWIKTPAISRAWNFDSSPYRHTLSRPHPVISSLWMHIRHFSNDAGDNKDDDDKNKTNQEHAKEEDEVDDDEVAAASPDGRRRSRRRQRTSTANSVQVIDNAAQRALRADEHVPMYPHVLAIPVYRRPLFPGVVVPMTISNPEVTKALLALKEAGQQFVGVFLKKRVPTNDKLSQQPNFHPIQMGSDDLIRDLSEIHPVGSYAKIDNLLAFEPSTLQLLLSAHRRIRIDSIHDADHLPLRVSISAMENPAFDPKSQVLRAYSNEIVATLREILNLNPVFKDHMQYFQQRIDVQDPYKLADFAAAVTTADCDELQLVMEEMNAESRLRKSLELLTKELELSKVQQVIKEQVEEKVSKNQRHYLLMEQLKVIKKELGLEKDDKDAMITKYRERLATFDRTVLEETKSLIPANVLEVIEEELAKFSMLEKNSSEFNVTRNYLDWLTQLPWGLSTDENFDLKKAKQILDEDHYGLMDIKDRILEFIAVSKLKNSVQGKIICFVGPPGVGKTSIGQSIARALNREFYRFSVGGLSDVAEIKGHRRTYVGAMPGKVIQCLKTTQSSNPLILIDEIDKLGRGGYQGDPASALLELLDPGQHNAFVDHYMDVPVDLSRVLFICTANVTDTIPGPLLDRMEVLRLSGYDAPEKLKIAKEYLIPKVIQRTGLQPHQGEENKIPAPLIKTPESLGLTDEAILTLVKQYCRESGVRNLEKKVERIFRKIALEVVQEQELVKMNEDGKEGQDRYIITPDKLTKYVGKPIFQSDRMYETLRPGVVMGLAWTAMGGSSLYIETTEILSKGEKSGLLTTGQMGSVMEESTKIAYTYARHKLQNLDPDNTFFDKSEIHLHVPEGATPKDGPSAGCTMVTAMLSLALNKAVRPDFAMTGELSLVGKVLPVGGIKEKVIAAKRSGVKTLVLPLGNQRDFDELEEYLREDIDVHFADYYDDVYKVAFQ